MKYKRYLILILVVSLVFYCRHKLVNHNIPIANIEFDKIENDKEIKGYYDLYFISNLELIENLKKNHDAQYLECFFKRMTINMNNFFNYKGFALKSVGELELVSKKSNKYTYKIETSFEDKSSNLSGGKENERVMKAITKFMNEDNDNCLSCVFTASAFMNVPKRYISNTMYIQKEELQKVLR